MDNQWISVKDRLPECTLMRDIFGRPSDYMSKQFLVCVKSTECDGIHYYVGIDVLYGTTLENIHWMGSSFYGGSAVYNQEITHWMPLPELPVFKEKKL